jgi:hypothetical protein
MLILGALLHEVATAQESTGQPPEATGVRSEDQILGYEAGYFSRYQPRTALDMVRQVPGFILNDGDNSRGFGSAAGNVLINGRRHTAKQNTPSEFLTRIAARQVQRIELIRSQLPGIDMLGHSSLVNVILQGDMPAVVRWESSARYNNRGPLKPSADVSLTDRWSDIDLTAGVLVEAEANGEDGYRQYFDGTGTLYATSQVKQKSTGIQVEGSLSASTWVGATLVNLNGKVSSDGRNPRQSADITPVADPASVRQEFIEDDLTIKSIELGGDAVRNLHDELQAKAMVLYYHEEIPKVSTRRLVNPAGVQTLLRTADGTTDTTESIARLEFNWSGIENHTIQLNLEGDYNAVDGSLVQTDDTGGGLVVVDVPGANTKVDEVRWDILLRDNWVMGNLELDYGLGAEFSTISQTGDSEQKQHFQYLKPHGIFTYAAGRGQKFRLRAQREIAQLDFSDFISTTVFDDNDVLLGNPDLHPDSTWILDIGYERRYGRTSAVKLTAFHHWIGDVLDLLPLTDTNAVPGNIGNGQRWGLELENTIQLDWLKLTGAKLNLTARWQDSTVVDPVTGLDRRLSAQSGNSAYRSLTTGNRNIHYFLRADFRQDFEAARVAWGWTIADRDNRPLFKVDEYDLYGESAAVDAFIETTRWAGIKVRLQVQNLMDFTEWRDRTIYDGFRDIDPIGFRELRERRNGRKITLALSGSF